MERFSLKNKNLVLTGAAGILGQKFSVGLAEAGAHIALVDLSAEAMAELQKKLTEQFPGQKFITYACNIADDQQVKEVVGKIEADFKNIHVLLNNAASKGPSLDDFFASFENYKLSVWRDIMSVNIDGMFLMAQAVGGHMIKNKIKGSIIQTASIYGVVAPDQRIYDGSFYLNRQISSPAVYSASKAAVIGLSNYLSAYWGAQGIRVNTITPGGMESGQNDTFKNKYSARVPMGRMGQPDELIGALIYLASDASSYTTGQNIMVDGGLSVW